MRARLEYLGRADEQVKIRGFRIEPGEVEACLLGHPGIGAGGGGRAGGSAGGARGWWLMWCRRVRGELAGRGWWIAAGLRSWLKGRLPDYLVPSVFVVLGRLPLTGSGKVDRRALPVPDVRVEQKAYVAPRSGAERVLAGIWAELLGAGQVGAEDNFFELGGDSILSIQVVSRARQAGLALSSKDMFVYQSIAELAAAGVLGRAAAPAAGAPEVAGPAPLAPIQRWFVQAGPGALGHFTMAVLAELDRALDVTAARRCWPARWTRWWPTMRRCGCGSAVTDGGWVQDVAPAGTAAVFDRRDLSGLAAGAQDAAMQAAAAAAQAGLDITGRPAGPGGAVQPGRGPGAAAVPHGASSGGRRGVLADLAGGPGDRLRGSCGPGSGRPGTGDHELPAVGPGAGRPGPRGRVR